MFEQKENPFGADEAFLDSLVEMLNMMPKAAVQIAVPKRVREMVCAKQLLERAFNADGVEVVFHSPGSSGALRLERDSIEVFEIDAFNRAVQLGNNFEIYPLTNGKVRFAMMFYGLLCTASYQA